MPIIKLRQAVFIIEKFIIWKISFLEGINGPRIMPDCKWFCEPEKGSVQDQKFLSNDRIKITVIYSIPWLSFERSVKIRFIRLKVIQQPFNSVII